MKVGNRCRAATPFASGCILRRAGYNFIWWKSRPEQTVEARPVKLRTHTRPRLGSDTCGSASSCGLHNTVAVSHRKSTVRFCRTKGRHLCLVRTTILSDSGGCPRTLLRKLVKEETKTFESHDEGRREIPTVLRSIVAIVLVKRAQRSINPVSIKRSVEQFLSADRFIQLNERALVLNPCEHRRHSKG